MRRFGELEAVIMDQLWEWAGRCWSANRQFCLVIGLIHEAA